MKKLYGLSLALGLWGYAHAQTDSLQSLDEVIIYAGKFAERKKNIVQKIDVISAKQISEVNTPTMSELLSNSGAVFVQKSQMGGGSPVLRGFEASRVLLVIDGIRMNNAIYRAGHLQNVLTVDQNMLERVEVLYGPASTLYGSDALGGAVLFRTKMPQLSMGNKSAFGGNAFIRYGSAANERTAHADVNIGGRKLAWLQSYTVSDFNDLRMGDNYPDDYPDFGSRSQYVARIGGIDSIVQNKDDRIQRYSGYTQWDITQKLLFKPGEKVSHVLNLQWSSSTDIPRYDRLQDVRNGVLRFAQWYYGPQKRGMAAYEFTINNAGPFDELKAIASYQHIEESRHQRNYRSNNLDNRIEKIDVVNVIVDARKLWQQHELNIGADAQLNDLSSTAFRQNINTAAQEPLDTRYPNGSNNMNNVGVYAQHLFKWGGGKWVLNDGLRLQAVSLRSTIANNSFFNLPFTEIDQDNIAVTGNIGVVFMPQPATRLTASIASGFRAPNVDDAARVFETSNAQLILPNADIEPEYSYTFDLGGTHTFSKLLRIEATGFYTLFRNAIALAPYVLNGQTSLPYNGSNVPLFANQNVNKAYVYGVQASATATLAKGLEAFSIITYTRGRLQQPGKEKAPLDHIPPVYGKTSIKYEQARWQAELFALYNGWKHLEDYNSSGEDNLQYATPDGMPSWATFNVRGGWNFTKALMMQAGIENIFDRNYRVFASGFSAPGRNVVLTLRAKI